MKSTLILAGASLVAAQYFPNQPSCAIPCLSAAITSVGCDINNISCQCGPTQASIGAAAVGCLLQNCAASDLAVAQSAGSAVCSSFSAGELTISSTATTGGAAATTTGSMSITSAPSTATTAASTGSLSDTLSRSGNTLISDSVTASDTKTIVGTVNSPSVSGTGISASGTKNAAPTAAAAKVGGILAGLVGIAAAL